ncbi:MAG: hypothetical protein AB7D57_08920 [Desulfovibrionaceae bacterium]
MNRRNARRFGVVLVVAALALLVALAFALRGQAVREAQTRADAFLGTIDPASRVRYDRVAVGPDRSARILGLSVRFADGAALTADELVIRRVQVRHGLVTALDASARGLRLPPGMFDLYFTMPGQGRVGLDTQDLDADVALVLDPEARTLEIRSFSLEVPHLLHLDLTAALAGVDAARLKASDPVWMQTVALQRARVALRDAGVVDLFLDQLAETQHEPRDKMAQLLADRLAGREGDLAQGLPPFGRRVLSAVAALIRDRGELVFTAHPAWAVRLARLPGHSLTEVVDLLGLEVSIN